MGKSLFERRRNFCVMWAVWEFFDGLMGSKDKMGMSVKDKKAMGGQKFSYKLHYQCMNFENGFGLEKIEIDGDF